MARKTTFSYQWLDSTLNPEFVDWLSDVPDNKFEAYCNVCRKKFKLSNMGRQAIHSHRTGPKHTQLQNIKSRQPSLSSFFVKPSASSTELRSVATSSTETRSVDIGHGSLDNAAVKPCVSSTETVKTEAGIESGKSVHCATSYFNKDEVAKAEILWALKVVASKYKRSSCADIRDTFILMFPDSAIASKFTFGESKCSYVINHGIAPHFSELLTNNLKTCEDYVVSFDESLNKVTQQGQMDLIVRFFDINTHKVVSRYWNSVFLGRATAQDLLQKFNHGLQPLQRKNLLQVSMDGPNVNLSFLRKLEVEMETENPDGKKLLNLGVCGLHVINGAVKTGLMTVNWELNSFLRNMYYLFKDSPARRAQFTAVTGSTVFPLKYCTVRWLENVHCLERALEVFHHIKAYVANAKLPESKSCKNIKEQIQDPLIKCKLAFFKTISLECEPFLRRFQSNKPLAPFLYSHLNELLRSLMNRFVKRSKMANAIDIRSVILLDLQDPTNLIEVGKVDVGFSTKKVLKELKLSEREILGFKHECQKILVAVVTKLLDKSPLKYRLVKGLTSLNPHIIYQQPSLGQTRMEYVLEALHEANRITENVADRAKAQYISLCCESKEALETKFKEYISISDDSMGLDIFFADILAENKQYSELWQVIKLCLILSHGNAAVESGFSINKSMLVENMHEESIIAQRQVYDSILYYGGVRCVPINHRMLLSVRCAHKKYQDYLEKTRLKVKEEDRKKAEKRRISDEIRKLEDEKKVKRMQSQECEARIEDKIRLLETRKNCV